jgi:pyrrolidone-carboxylate peptidase
LADNKGNLPIKVKIVEDRHLDEPLGTNLNVSALKETGNKHFPLKVSADPGRYICNYIYYRSLSTISNKFEGNHSLFIHFPFSKEPIHETRDENFMMHIFEQLLTSKNLST